MIVKDYSSFKDEKGEIPLVERIRGTLKDGSSWFADIQGQEHVISRMQSLLDDQFILLRNLVLPGLDVPIPLILISRAGLQVISVSAVKGIYQAKGELWQVMNTNSRRFRPSRPNIINRALLLTQAISRHLDRFDYGYVPLDAVNIFTDPGVHVDTKGPATRIVMIDALDRYIANLPQSVNTLSAADANKIVDLLTNPPSLPGARGAASSEEDRRIQEAFSIPRSGPVSSNMTEVQVPILGSLRFSNRQWLLLGGLVIIDVIVLAAFIIIALSSA
jgi:hypothetical protein